jgi:hypothetical protein
MMAKTYHKSSQNKTIPGMGRGVVDKGERWKEPIQLRYIIRTFVDVIVYPQEQ